MAITQTNTRKRIIMPYQVPRIWSGQAADNIQGNFEKLFQVFSEVTETETPTTGAADYIFDPATSTYFEMWTQGNGVVNVGIVNTSTTTGGAGAVRATPPFADGPYLYLNTAVLNATLTVNAPTGTTMQMDLIWDFDVSFVIRTYPTITSRLGRILIGVCQNNPNTDSPTEAGCYFRYSTAVADAGWVGLCHDGTTLSARSQVITGVANSTRYLFRIRKIANVAYFSINGGPEVPVTSNVPVTTRTGVGPKVRLTNLDGVDQALYFSRAWCVYGT